MINSNEFAHRLQQIMDLYQLTGSAFAESVGVQRSAISHILSGRNKPSLDFVLKILDTYPDIELYWLLNGKGDGPLKQENEKQRDLFNSPVKRADLTPGLENKSVVLPDSQEIKTGQAKRKVVKIVLFYDDHTFEEINNADYQPWKSG